MYVHEAAGGLRDRKQSVGLRRDLAHAAADQHHEIGVLDASEQLRIWADAEVAGVKRMQRVEQWQAAVARDHRDLEALDETTKRGAGVDAPSATSQDHHRTRCGAQHVAQRFHVLDGRSGFDRHLRRRVGHGDPLHQHVFRQAQDDRAGPSARRRMKRARYDLGDARGIVDLVGPFRHAAEDGAIVDLLERLATAHAALHLSDEHDEGRRILLRDVDAGHRIGGAGAARDEADTRSPRRLADGVRHHRGSALLAAHRHLDRSIVERIEHGEIALARHAEHVLDAVRDELIDENFRGRTGGDSIVHGVLARIRRRGRHARSPATPTYPAHASRTGRSPNGPCRRRRSRYAPVCRPPMRCPRSCRNALDDS